MNRDLTQLLLCPDCHQPGLQLETYEGTETQVREGRLLCPSCQRWYRIENGVVDLLPAHLRRHDLNARFAARHRIADTVATEPAQEAFKASQIEFFGSHVEDYEAKVVQFSLYTAFNEVFFLRWVAERLKPGDRVLDLGCGTGAPCQLIARQGIRCLGIDISEEMLVLGQRKAEAEGLSGQLDYMAADAERPPVIDGRFQAAVFLGALHHLPDPALAIRSASTRLAPGGHFYSQDPHKSPVRFLFDWLMRVWKLYDEEASEDPLLTEAQLQAWMKDAGLQGRTRLSIYLPPHVFRLCNHAVARVLLRSSDAAFGVLPGLRRWAGFIVADGSKQARAPA